MPDPGPAPVAAARAGSRCRGPSRPGAHRARACAGPRRHERRPSEQAVTGQDDAGIAGEGGEQVELPRSQPEIAVRDRCLPPARIDAQGPNLHRPAAACRRLGSTEDGLDPGDERPGVERLRDVVVGTQLETDDRVDVIVAGRQHEHGGIAAATDLATDLQPVDLRQHEVQDHEIRVVAGVFRQGFLAVRGGDDGEPFLLEIEADEVDDVALVVDDEDRLHALGSARSAGGVGRVIAAEDTPRGGGR